MHGGSYSGGSGGGSGSYSGGSGTRTYSLGLQEMLRLLTPISSVRCPVYDPAICCVFFVENNHALVRLDSSGTAVGLVARNLYTQRATGADGAAAGDGGVSGDGAGQETRLYNITGLAPDGKGTLFIADRIRIRVLDVATCQLTSLPAPAGRRQRPIHRGTDCRTTLPPTCCGPSFTARAICRVDVAAAANVAAATAAAGRRRRRRPRRQERGGAAGGG
ncbi:Ankyrin repeat and BTB/POZ domain-containing protein 1 [Pleodorina starrii]|uniref:Ankyrin repeat and BTB/POZ domain-containing protein 1 n=1 Tax=Pleodorina starrii TaxID=330485 RepID=A0A9W6BU13_9CHLO|nr:Ankyrin repeat and BTB/POZ domain-containing protein 1 [Pleodorina starrii]